MGRKWIVLSFILCMLLSCSLPVRAQELDFGRMGSVSVTLTDQEANAPIAGAKFAISMRAILISDGNGSWEYVDEDGYQAEGITDANGTVVFHHLPLGLYYIEQVGTVEGFAPCKPFEVRVPMSSGNVYLYDVDASPKTETMIVTSITIKKIWNTGASVKAADSVTVNLLCDGAVVETAVLNEANHWSIVYENMPVSDGYSIEEVNVPNGFTATYLKNGYDFTVTNTPALAQTGQLVWPIPVLTLIGLFLISTGGIIIYKTRRQDA